MLYLCRTLVYARLVGWLCLLHACSGTNPEEQPRPTQRPSFGADTALPAFTLEPPAGDSAWSAGTPAAGTPRVEKPKPKPPRAEFETLRYDYGTIAQDSIINYVFKFKNAGELPLEINDVRASCGCSVASFSFLPIVQGEQSEIKARFDSKGKRGKQRSEFTVLSNAGNYTLILEGTVVERQ